MSTTATTGIPSLRASSTAIASLLVSTTKMASGRRFMVLIPARFFCELLALALELDDFLLGEELVAAVGGHMRRVRRGA